MAKITYRILLRLWLQQGFLLLIATLVFWWFSPLISYSILVGGLIYIIPNMYFSVYAFRFRGVQATQQVLLGFYRGEVGKFLLSSVGFAAVFTLVNPLNVLALFMVYVVLTVVQWLQLAKIQS
ncbi:hypothetical protein AB835_10265 [Candidatus Endobugula sertula]|uniref:F0F1 ATP synthase subunit I n=1 Tax=Candidatus Endobugula sertula TaxID=62101 RepID=A0A1D2QNK9_9GAMM|nr:hypothetical protein AB835_10265 [Candidatus Endobugula sertula]